MRSSRTIRKVTRKGFTLVEILIVVIILGILAAIVIPQFTNASTAARTSNMVSQLQTLRSQVQLYKLQHGDTVPALDGPNGWNLFTKCTNATGTISNAQNPLVPDANFPNGPYVPSALVNPLTNSSTLANTVSATTGWWFDVTSGEVHGIAINSTTGAAFKTDDGSTVLP